ncbi:MAG: hypothetical protein K0S43_382 [Cellulosimicrobium sp.]|jgi:hypothetical protein|nr:hypothetical protein [Cellulosimicrobium sp.]
MSARITRATATSLRTIEDWSLELSAAIAAGDVERAGRAAATIAQAVHEVQLDVDPRRDHCAALTLVNGVYSEAHRPAAARELDEAIALLGDDVDEPVPFVPAAEPLTNDAALAAANEGARRAFCLRCERGHDGECTGPLPGGAR